MRTRGDILEAFANRTDAISAMADHIAALEALALNVKTSPAGQTTWCEDVRVGGGYENWFDRRDALLKEPAT